MMFLVYAVAVTLAFFHMGYKRSAELVGQKQAKLHVLETQKMNIAWNFRPTKYYCQFSVSYSCPWTFLAHSLRRHTYKTHLLQRLIYEP